MYAKPGWVIGLRRNVGAVLLGALAGCASESGAATLGIETFGDGLSSWVDRDAGEMAVTYNAGFGHTLGIPPEAGSLQGTFALQGESSPETDAFRINTGSSSGDFTGNYWTGASGFSSWSFSFYADDVLPSDLLIRFNDGVNTFVRTVLSQVVAQDTWYTVTVPLTYAGWLGGSASAFSNALSNVSFIDVQLTRNGTAAQDFFIDNFALNGPSGGGGGVPEPSTAGLLLASVAVLRAARKKGSRARQALAGLWSPGVSPAPAATRTERLSDAEPVVDASPRRQNRRKLRKKKIQLIY